MNRKARVLKDLSTLVVTGHSSKGNNNNNTPTHGTVQRVA